MFKKALTTTILCSGLILNSQAQAEDNSVNEKIEFIQQALNDEYNHSFIWQNGWTTLMGVSLVMNIVGYTKDDIKPAEKYDNGVGIITSTLGFGDMLISPLLGYKYASKLEDMPEKTAAEKAYKLEMAEKFLEKAALRQQEKRNWQAHASSLLVSALAGAAIAFDDNRKKDGLNSFIISMIGSEIKIFTSPNNLTDDLNRYRNQYTAKTYKQQNYWQVSTNGSSIKFGYHF